jgi:Ca-activated chloride channel family protein
MARHCLYHIAVGMIVAAFLFAGCTRGRLSGTDRQQPVDTVQGDPGPKGAENEKAEKTAKPKQQERKNEVPPPVDMSALRVGRLKEARLRREGLTHSYIQASKTPLPGGRAMRQDPAIAPPAQRFNTEQYDHIADNAFRAVADHPLSTFSIDVDAASYANVRRFLTRDQLPPKDAVRIEELINYFTYDYPQPKGEHPFSITTEMGQCPWDGAHRLVHVGLQGKRVETKDLPPNNLVFLLDVSGSMNSPDKLPLLKKAMTLLVHELRPRDRIAIVVYAGAAGLVLPSTPGDRKADILSALEGLSAGGSTAGGAGIQLAYKTAKEHLIREGNNRVILATDGDFNIGMSSDGDLVRMIEKKRDDNIFLTVLGFGTGNYKDSKMEKLADKGNGNYAYIDNLLEAKKVLVNEMGGTLLTIAKDVKIQVEFNPAKVGAYRLIGYVNRLLNKEDFNDDTRDAGELGAGHTVTALYEIVPAGETMDLPKVDELKYQQQSVRRAAKTSDEMLTVKLRYKQPDGDKSTLLSRPLQDRMARTLSDNFRFSAAVAGFGMLLRDSEHKGTLDWTKVLTLAREARGEDTEGYRSEFVGLIERAQMLDKLRG